MLRIVVEGQESFDEQSEKFVYGPDTVLEMEHSLLSLSKWESIWTKPFLGNDKSEELNDEEILSYFHCMCKEECDADVFERMTPIQMSQISEYIQRPQTATVVTYYGKQNGSKNKIVTSELIYYWMICFNIPFTCESWPLPRLMKLIEVCQVNQNEGQKGNKMSRKETMSRNRALNQARRQQLNSKG